MSMAFDQEVCDTVADLFPEISLKAEVESCCLHQEHHNVHHDRHKLVVRSKIVILGEERSEFNSLGSIEDIPVAIMVSP